MGAHKVTLRARRPQTRDSGHQQHHEHNHQAPGTPHLRCRRWQALALCRAARQASLVRCGHCSVMAAPPCVLNTSRCAACRVVGLSRSSNTSSPRSRRSLRIYACSHRYRYSYRYRLQNSAGIKVQHKIWVRLEGVKGPWVCNGPQHCGPAG
jgi:hypothetical protein